MKRTPIPKRKKLGEILVSQGRLTPDRLTELLRKQKETSKPLGQLLVEEEVLTAG